MDVTTQIVLLLMTLVLGSTLVVVGIMLFFVLKDLRESISRVNLILDDVEEITGRLSEGSELVEDTIVGIHSVVTEFRDKAVSPISAVLTLLGMFGSKMRKGGEDNG